MKIYFFFCYLFIAKSLWASTTLVTIHTRPKPCTFSVEIASTPLQKERGLMFRKHLRYNHGMLFLYESPQMVRFWMKNTYLSLDLLFIDSQGKIVQIYEKMQPLSQKIISSQKPIKAVLELFAGSVTQYNIKVNQVIQISPYKDK